MGWAYGDKVEWREVWRDRILAALPVRVVADRDELLALYIAEGTPFSFPEQWPWDTQHPWARRGRWEGHGALVLHRPGDDYTVWALWQGTSRTFAGWYVNLQDAFRRSARTLDTFDHELDIWVTPGGAWRYKDDDLLDQGVRAGRFSAAEAAGIRATARRVAGDLEQGRRWWREEWAAWEPEPPWSY